MLRDFESEYHFLSKMTPLYTPPPIKKTLNYLFPIELNWEYFEDFSLTIERDNNYNIGFASAPPFVKNDDSYTVIISFKIRLIEPKNYSDAIFALQHTVKPFANMKFMDIVEHQQCLNKLIKYAQEKYPSSIETLYKGTPYIDPLLNGVSELDAHRFIETFCSGNYRLTLHNIKFPKNLSQL